MEMVCKCIKDIASNDGLKFSNGNYYTYFFNNDVYCITKPGKPVYNIPNYNQVMNLDSFNEHFMDVSKVKKEVKVESKGPSKISVCNIVDKSLIDLLTKGLGFLEAKENLRLRNERLKVSFEKDMKSCELLKNVDPDVLLHTPEYWGSVESSRVKYHLYYISHCLKRIEDINWCLRNRLKFYDYNSLQLFNLIKLKEKLSIENSEPVIELSSVDLYISEKLRTCVRNN